MANLETPIEDALRRKLIDALSPSKLIVHNDSHLHAHHAAMRGNTSRETHFRLEITSSKFEGLRPAARHRLVYGLLTEEMQKEGGIHALQLRTKTEEEEAKEREKEQGGKADVGT
ncbi:bola-like protein-domain-containing protein [Kalaharituber pfeilii]|nr:bola-like protein-domain-containing protein [Kalaharituber pfeilii]